MKRVWKPLDVGGLRLYQVDQKFQEHPEWNQIFIVAADSPMHAESLIIKIYEETEFIEDPYYVRSALNVYMPENWWIDGVPCSNCNIEGRG